MRLFIYAIDVFEGDAVGNHCLGIARNMRTLGWDAKVFARHFDMHSGEVANVATMIDQVTADDLLLVSYSIVDPLLDALLALPCRKVCYFHGVTDPELLREFEPVTADLCEQARAQFPLLACFDLVIANSVYVARYLAPYMDLGAIRVMPPVLPDLPSFAHVANSVKQPEALNMLVLGRVVPHKRIEDAIAVLAEIVKLGVDATLTVVGTAPNYDYTKYLLRRARELGVLTRTDFTGMVDDCDLLDCYERASVMLSTSRHEGFCIPAMEAMSRGMLTVVRAGHAAEEVVGDAGLVIAEEETQARTAERIVALHGDLAAWHSLNNRARQRARELLVACTAEVWSEILLGVRRAVAT